MIAAVLIPNRTQPMLYKIIQNSAMFVKENGVLVVCASDGTVHMWRKWESAHTENEPREGGELR